VRLPSGIPVTNSNPNSNLTLLLADYLAYLLRTDWLTYSLTYLLTCTLYNDPGQAATPNPNPNPSPEPEPEPEPDQGRAHRAAARREGASRVRAPDGQPEVVAPATRLGLGGYATQYRA